MTRRNLLAWLLVIILVVAPRVFDLVVFYARDELTIWGWADQFALAVWQGDWGGTLTPSDYPGIPMFWTQTAFLAVKYNFSWLFSTPTLPLERLFEGRSLELLAERRLAAGLLVSLQLIVVVGLARRLWGWRVALLSAIFLGLDPFSLSEARLLRLEMMSDLFVTLSVLVYLLYLRQRHWRWLVLSGVMAGLGVSSKTSAGLVVTYIALLWVLDFWLNPVSHWAAKGKRLITAGLLWSVAAIGAFWLIWPAMWVNPLAAIQHVFVRGLAQAASDSVWHGDIFFGGQISAQDPGPFFYPVALAFRTTPLTWLGVVVACIWLAALVKRVGLRRSTLTAAWYRQTTGVQVSLLLIYAALLLVELTFVLSKVDRFLLIIFPALNIVSAVGLALALEWLVRQVGRFRKLTSTVQTGLWAVLGAIILVFQLSLTLPAHPYFFTYWNPWLGGGPAAVKTLLVGSGEGVDLAMDYLNSRPNAARSTLVCGGSQPWCSRLFKGTTWRYATYTDGQWAQADYVSFYVSHLQRNMYPSEVVDFFMRQPPLYQADLQGITYMSVYAVPKIAHFAGTANDLAGLGRLLGYNLEPAPVDGESRLESGQPLTATVWWTNWGAGVDRLTLRLVDETGYTWAQAGVIPSPEYAGLPANQRAVISGTVTLFTPGTTPPGLYFLRLGVLSPDKNRRLGEFNMPAEANRVLLTPGQPVTDPAQLDITKQVDRLLAPEVSLLGYTPPAEALTPTTPTWLTLYWQTVAAPADYRVQLRLLDSAGKEVTRWQGPPARGHYPTSNWRVGEIVRDVWALQTPPHIAPGQYHLELSLTGSGLPAVPTFVDLGEVEVWPQVVTYDLPDMQNRLEAAFGDDLLLLGYDLYFDVSGSARRSLAPVFYWQSRADFEETFDLILTLRQVGDNQVITEWRVPLGTSQAKTLWKAGEVMNTPYQLEVKAAMTGRYNLDIALQNQSTGQFEPVQLNGQEATFLRIVDAQDKLTVRVVNP